MTGRGAAKGDAEERKYRGAVVPPRGWTSFSVRYRQSDLMVQAPVDVRGEAERLLLEARIQVERYGQMWPQFLDSHVPLPADPLAPSVVKGMLAAAMAAGVGPMAAVAGAVAHYVGANLARICHEVVVENGGDLYVQADRPLVVGVFAGRSPLSERIAIRVRADRMPLGIATSSASVGHSWSYGAADAACVMASDPALADAVATALGNRVRGEREMEPAVSWALGIPGVRGSLVILGETMAAKGEVELVPL
ncbi:MAG: UPF0280 family protein [Thermodesulfobacteriota bacterium]